MLCRPASSYAMLREILEQPAVLAHVIEEYAAGTEHAAAIFDPLVQVFTRSERMVILASGSSRHAGLAAEIMLEDLAGIPVDVEYASEYTYRSTATPCLSSRYRARHQR
jgi:glucosamine--fructose-6-phosphate aminotransferase (isomerizing)